jgi:hypothetical protein
MADSPVALLIQGHIRRGGWRVPWRGTCISQDMFVNISPGNPGTSLQARVFYIIMRYAIGIRINLAMIIDRFDKI